MNLEEIIRIGIEQKATDIHLEPKSPITLRVNGALKRLSTAVDAGILKNFARRILSEEQWDGFAERGSADICLTIAGVPCRINVLSSDRGTGFAIRLLSTMVNTLATCNLHPSLLSFIERDTGLIILTGPTGSGKSTTLAALIEEINARESRHIITLESPIEYRHVAKKSLIRQREVGRHTPSYDQGLLDALREDPDVLIVGEMREPEAMRLTLNAAETGHLVLATMHSANAMDAIYRIMMSFPPERQSSVLAQVADSLIAVISHKMTYRGGEELLVPACEILVGNYPTKNVVRKGDISKMPSILQTGGPEGMFTFERYQAWLDEKTDWVYPEPPAVDAVLEDDGVDEIVIAPRARPAKSRAGAGVRTGGSSRSRVHSNAPPPDESALDSSDAADAVDAADGEIDGAISNVISDADSESTLSASSRPSESRASRKKATAMKIHKDGRIEIPEVDLDLEDLVKEFKNRSDG